MAKKVEDKVLPESAVHGIEEGELDSARETGKAPGDVDVDSRLKKREIFFHRGVSKVLTDKTRVFALDEPAEGGASHDYEVVVDRLGDLKKFRLCFQKGGVVEAGGINGIPDEALYAILIDRMRGFQAGPFGCRETALALQHLEESLHWQQARTRDRQARGVEGRSKV